MKFHRFLIACRTNTSLTFLDLQRNQIGDVGASGIGAGLAYAHSCHPKFLIIDFYTLCLYIGAISVFVCVFDSQNTSLKELYLYENQIGDVGASGIGAGLAYVVFRHCE